MGETDLKLYANGAGGGGWTGFPEAPALTDADGNPIAMTIGGGTGIADVSAGFRFFPADWLAVGLRVGGTYQGGSVPVLDTIDSATPELYYAAPQCDDYVTGGVGNVGSAGNCGVGDPLDTGSFNWNRAGLSLFVPFSFRLPEQQIQLELAPGIQREWGLDGAQIMIPGTKGFVDLENVDSVKLEASVGKYFGDPDKTQVGVFATWRGTLASQGEVFVPGEDRYEAIPGAGNQIVMLRVEGEFDTDPKPNTSRSSTTDRAAERARKTREREAAAERRSAEAEARRAARTAARTDAPNVNESYARTKMATDWAATMTQIGATKVSGSDTKYLYAEGEIIFEVAFVPNPENNSKVSAPILDVSDEPTGFGYKIKKINMTDERDLGFFMDRGNNYGTFADLAAAVRVGDFAVAADREPMTLVEATSTIDQKMHSAMRDISATESPSGYFTVKDGDTTYTFHAEYVANPSNDPKVSALILDDAGNTTGHGYRIKIKIGSTVPVFINKLDGSHYTFDDIVRIKKAGSLEDTFGVEVKAVGLQFLSTSATFTIGSAPSFEFSGNDLEIDHIECRYQRALDTDIDYDVSGTSLTVTGLADMSTEVRDDVIATIPVDATTMVRSTVTTKAGKGNYTLVVIMEDGTEKTLTATAK